MDFKYTLNKITTKNLGWVADGSPKMNGEKVVKWMKFHEVQQEEMQGLVYLKEWHQVGICSQKEKSEGHWFYDGQADCDTA